jgi:hypothetical protein
VPERIEDDDWSTLDAGRRRQLVLHALALANREARGAGLRSGFDGPSWHLSRSPLELDEQAVVSASQLLRRTLDDVARIAKEADDRAGERQPYLVVLLGFSSRPTAQESDA